MNYSDLLQLNFERSNAMQNCWNLYVLIVGGVLAFSSLRKHPAAITTLLVMILFALFACKNLGAMKDCTTQGFALLDSTLNPATYGGVKKTHLTSDILAICALVAMEFRRRRLQDLALSVAKNS